MIGRRSALMAGAMGALGLGLTASLGADEPAVRTAAAMGRGVNILGYDGLWSGATDAPFRRGDFGLIRRAGFRHVRINLFGFKYLDADLRLDPVMLDQLDEVLRQADSAGLVPVLDEHDAPACQAEPVPCARKLQAFWRQVSARYAGREPKAVFELLNEPGGAMTQASWNALVSTLLSEIRAANPTRTVIVGALNAQDPHAPSGLALPEDDRALIVSVHYYKPFRFTHQGAPWDQAVAGLHDVTWGSPEDQREVEDEFALLDAWAKAALRPLYLGEFGAYERAPMASRARYLGVVSRLASRLGWPWAVWQFDHDFALFDRTSNRWVAPLLKALGAAGQPVIPFGAPCV